MVMPSIDDAAATATARVLAERALADALVLVVHDESRQGFVSVLNTVARRSRSPWIGYVAQDAFPGVGWLRIALDTLRCGRPGLFAFNDGKWFGLLASFGLASRAWAEGNYGGDVFFPGYRSHYGDTEISLLAAQQGVLYHDPRSVLLEVDYAKARSSVDPRDRALFLQRRNGGFSGRVQSAELLARFS